MKLRTKLLINFTLLFFILINIFGFTLIKIIFYTSLNSSIESGYREYNIIYSNLKTGETMSRQFFDIQDIITLKNKTYLHNSGTGTVDIQVEDMNRNIIFSSFVSADENEKALYEFADTSVSNYMIAQRGENHFLYINHIITFHDEKYYLLYRNDIEYIYTERNQCLFLLLLFNIIGGVLSVFIIYYFTKAITTPLQKLINNIEEIIQKNHYTRLRQSSDIQELKILTDNFNTMSHEISVQMATLEQSNQQKQRFIDSLTHEIRTPLTSIIGYSSLCLNKSPLSEAVVQQAFENIHKNGKRIEMLTENLIKLITMDKTPLNLKEVSIRSVLEDVRRSYEDKIERESIKFRIEGKDMVIVTDEYLLSMLFSNFIDNAVKAVAGCPEKQIILSFEGNSLSICDSGKGMTKEDLGKIFEPFYMTDKSRKRDFEGFGLGLSICKNIMEILNIKFSIQSKVKEGTKIVLIFSGGAYEEK